MSTSDEHDLSRFVEAQSSTYERALAELRSGRKRSHWMWYIFPQLAGLGRSATSRHYAIGNADEAKAYLAHPRNALNINGVTPSTPFCQSAPKNAELKSVVHKQLDGVNPGLFGSPALGVFAFGDRECNLLRESEGAG